MLMDKGKNNQVEGVVGTIVNGQGRSKVKTLSYGRNGGREGIS